LLIFNIFKVSYSGYKKEEIADLFKSSKAVLDITHPNQKGLTSRTFEALRSGSKTVPQKDKSYFFSASLLGYIFSAKRGI
jgi:hypothetical protein